MKHICCPFTPFLRSCPCLVRLVLPRNVSHYHQKRLPFQVMRLPKSRVPSPFASKAKLKDRIQKRRNSANDGAQLVQS